MKKIMEEDVIVSLFTLLAFFIIPIVYQPPAIVTSKELTNIIQHFALSTSSSGYFRGCSLSPSWPETTIWAVFNLGSDMFGIMAMS